MLPVTRCSALFTHRKSMLPSRNRGSAAHATRLVEGDKPRRDELDVHIRGIDASLFELRPQPGCIGQWRRTLHVDDDHAAAGADVARGPADLIAERTCCRQR